MAKRPFSNARQVRFVRDPSAEVGTYLCACMAIVTRMFRYVSMDALLGKMSVCVLSGVC